MQAFPLTSCSTIRWLGSGASAVGWCAGGSDSGGWPAAAAAAALLPPPLSTSISCVAVGGVGLDDGARDGADRNGASELGSISVADGARDGADRNGASELGSISVAEDWSAGQNIRRNLSLSHSSIFGLYTSMDETADFVEADGPALRNCSIVS